MRFGAAIFPNDLTSDPIFVRDFAQTAEGLGYDHLVVVDHVLGADRTNRPNWRGPTSSVDIVHETFVLLGYLAAITERVELVTSVLVLPQRQTALVAKQAAEVDVLSGGRLRLGIGVGWNAVEFEALGEDFHNRGHRSEEQIAVMRKLWTEPVVTFHGRWHRISEAGINPLPVQRPIPIWLGGTSERTLQRVARIGDGWIPLSPPNDTTRAQLDRLRRYIEQAGRSPNAIGIETWLHVGRTKEGDWVDHVETWRGLGATHLHVWPGWARLKSPQEHIAVLERAKDVLGF